MTTLSQISASSRDRAGKGAARATRRSGLVPAVVYGDNQAPALIALDPRIIHSEMRRKGFHTRIFSIAIEGKGSERAMVRDVQFHPVTDQPLHVDFLRLGKDSKVHVAIPVTFINELASPGIKAGGVLNVVHHEIELVVKPDNLPDSLVVDLTGLDVGASIHLDAVTLPEGATVVSHEKSFTIATIVAPTVKAS